jgi:hypothetical protein
MVVDVGLAVLFIGAGLAVPWIVRCIRTKFSGGGGTCKPQKNTLIVTLGFWTGASDENASGSVGDKASGTAAALLNQTLAANISKNIFKEVFEVSFYF